MKAITLAKCMFATGVTIASLFLGGCSTPPLTMNYAPSSVLSASGNVNVGSFIYTPAQSGKIKPNQIRNTALGTILFEKNINDIYKEAVFKELRFVGVKMNDAGVTLTGDVQEFLIDDLGYSVDWTLVVKYVVTKQDGTVVYEAVKTMKKHTSKFDNVFGTLNEVIKLNIEELIKDEEFKKVIG